MRDLSFTLRRGETLCIAGESGSGKSDHRACDHGPVAAACGAGHGRQRWHWGRQC
ncbi:MAG: ATP-binding cassette domain-containing protein [Cypionkella sp.]